MAVIQKIREKYAKLAGFVIALALVGFILMDAASGKLGDLFGHDSSLAKVNGEKIDGKEYSQRAKEYETLYSYSSQGKTPDDNTRAQINDEALRDLINEKIIRNLSSKIGLLSTKEEEKDLIYGAIPDPTVQQFPYFANKDTKMFDPQYVKAFEQQVNQVDPTGKLSEQWEAIKSYVLRANLLKKINAVFAKNAYVPKFIMEFQQKEAEEIASIRYVKVPYSSIPDEQVVVKDEELEAYMKKHPAMFTADETSRSIDYVAFDVIPAAEDTVRALGALNTIKSEFETTSDNESIVNRNSDEPYRNVYVNKAGMMSAYSDSILNKSTGTVFGPYFENGSYKLTKIVDKKTLPDSAKVRHILVKTKVTGQDVLPDSLAKKKLDSAIVMIKATGDFNGAVQKYSEDDGSKQTAGEYTFTLQQRPNISTEFGDFAFEGKPGETKIVKVDNQQYAGYHYIEILEQKGIQTSAKLATVTKALYAGDNTENAVFAKANEFAGTVAGDAKKFDEAIKSENQNKRLAENIKVSDFSVPGLGSAREIVRWVYEAKVGEVSTVFQQNGRYIIAKMTGIQEPGLMKLTASIKPQVEMQVKKEKKADMITAKYKAMGNIDAIAQASAQPAKQIDTFNTALQYIADLGFEPKVMGYAFFKGFNANAMSPAIKGNDGVFFETLMNRSNAKVYADPAIQQQKMSMMESQIRNASGSLLDMIRKNADVSYTP